MVQHELGVAGRSSEPIRARGDLDIRQRDYPAGLQIWASNPALIWTSSRREQEGIHVHGWHRNNVLPKLDGTFGRVRIDGIELNEQQLRVFMAQNALIYLKGKVVALECPSCGASLFDEGEAAFRPSNKRFCDSCGAYFATRRGRKVVSNPFAATIRALKGARRKG